MAIEYRKIATIPCPHAPETIAVAPNGNAYVTLRGVPTLGVINRASHTMTLMGGTYHSLASGVAVAPDTGYVYVAIPDRFSEYPPFRNVVAQFIPNDGWARRDIPIDCNSVGNLTAPRLGTDLCILVQESADDVLVVNRMTHTVTARITTTGYTGLQRLEATPDGSRIYVIINDELVVINRATDAVETKIPFDVYISAMSVSPDGTRLYLCQSSRVTVLNTATNTVQNTIQLDGFGNIGAIAVSPDAPHLYVTPMNYAQAVTAINTTTHAMAATIPLGGNYVAAPAIAVTPDGMLLYVLLVDPHAVALIERIVRLRYLSVKVTAGSAPEWLVSRYAVECTYLTPNGVRSCGNAVFDHNGGVVEGLISDEGGTFPATILVTVTIDFAPDTGLQGLVKQFNPPVTDTGVNFLFEPRQVMQKTDLFFDLRPTPLAADYLVVRWSHNVGGGAVASGNKYLSSEELRQQPLAQYSIVFALGPVSDDDLRLEIVGRYQDQELPRFQQTFQLSDGAIVLRAQRASPDTDYGLVVV